MIRGLYTHHPLRDPVVGTVESISRITPETLYRCHRAFYRPSNMVLCCVGDVDPQAVADIAAETLSAEPGELPQRDYGEAETLFPAETRASCEMDISVPFFCAGAKLPPMTGSEGQRRQLLGELALQCLLGQSSAWYSDLYARGLINRSFSGSLDSYSGAAAIVLGGESRDPEAVLDYMQEQLGQIARCGIDEAAFERCRRVRYSLEITMPDSFRAYAGALFRGWFNGYNTLEDVEVLRSVSCEDAAAFLCENLTADRLGAFCVRPLGSGAGDA